jgi:hypothetical protein
MGPDTEDLTGGESSTLALLVWLAVFALAFGYIEGAVAHYLRMHLYPDGFDDTIVLVVDPHTLAVEVGRELCTLLLIAAVAALTRGPFIRRLASFAYVFGIWDLSYYAALWIFEGWPASLYDWDLLFLLPVPWFSPVLAPMAISAIGIVGAVSVHVILDRRGELVVPWHGLALVNAALVAWEISFMAHEGPRTGFPTRYRWWLFIMGVALSCCGYLLTWWRNARLWKPGPTRGESGRR